MRASDPLGAVSGVSARMLRDTSGDVSAGVLSCTSESASRGVSARASEGASGGVSARVSEGASGDVSERVPGIASGNTSEHLYWELCETAKVSPLLTPVKLENFSTDEGLANCYPSERVTAGIKVLLDMVTSDDAKKLGRVDRVLIDRYIARLDRIISARVDAVLHHPKWQACESLWRSLLYLVNQVGDSKNVKIEILDVSKQVLLDDFNESVDITASGLYKHVYTQEYDMPGGEPISAIIANYDFDAGQLDLNLLEKISQVSSVSHAPFIAAASPSFFYLDSQPTHPPL